MLRTVFLKRFSVKPQAVAIAPEVKPRVSVLCQVTQRFKFGIRKSARVCFQYTGCCRSFFVAIRLNCFQTRRTVASASASRRVVRPGMEPGPAASETVLRSSIPTHHAISTLAWSRTRTKTLREPCAVVTPAGLMHPSVESRRLDLHQHHPVYKTGAFLCRATSASRVPGGSRTLTFCFTGRCAYHVHYEHHVFPSGRCGGQDSWTPRRDSDAYESSQNPTAAWRPSMCSVDRPGIEPGLPPSHGGVFPLDHQPSWFHASAV